MPLRRPSGTATGFDSSIELLDRAAREELSSNIYISPRRQVECQNVIKQVIDELTVKKMRFKINENSKIFVSHSYKDKVYAEAIVSFLEDIGLTEKQIFCSSVPGYEIPLEMNISEYLFKQFRQYTVRGIFLLSDHYYESPYCLNEMGIICSEKCHYTSILLQGFKPEDMKGLVDSDKVSLVVDHDIPELQNHLQQFRNILSEEFGLMPMGEAKWIRKRDELIERLRKLD